MVLAAKKKEALQRLYTVEEFEQLPEFAERYELINGRLIKRHTPGYRHGLIIDVIRDAIKAHDPERQLGHSLQEISVRIGPRSAPTPDMSYWKASRQVEITDGAAPLPDLAVEVLSPSDVQSETALRSAMVKVYRLITAGVPLVWVVNPKEKTVEVYHTGQAEPVTLSIDDQLDGEDVIPGFSLPIATLFEYNLQEEEV